MNNEKNRLKPPERLEVLLKHLKETKYSLSKKLGFVNGSVFNNIANGRNGISGRLAKQINDKYPEINYKWLMDGEGEMIVETKPEPKDNLRERIEFLERHIKGQDARIELLETKVGAMLTNANKKPQRA